MSKIKCVLIGSGNIATDLLYKLRRSEVLEPIWRVGIDPESEGLARAQQMGLKTTAAGVDGVLPHLIADEVRIAFDATSAYVHKDEFTYTTSTAVCAVGGAKKGKALCVINPAEPPMIMRNTIYCLTEEAPDQEKITASLIDMIAKVQEYVPGYKLVNGPVFDGNKVAIFMEVAGLGDYLPTYAGNLDIMTAAACRTAEMYAEKMLSGEM